MNPAAASRSSATENANRIAVVAALSATTMLFASLASAYVVRRSFADWRPFPARWPFVLLLLGLLASSGIEMAARSSGSRRRLGLRALAWAGGLYFAGVLAVIGATVRGVGLGAPYEAFVVLLLGVHLAHALAAGGFAVRMLGAARGAPSENDIFLARLVIHFLTALLLAVILLLFVLR